MTVLGRGHLALYLALDHFFRLFATVALHLFAPHFVLLALMLRSMRGCGCGCVVAFLVN